MDIIQEVTKEQMKDVPDFNPGDTILIKHNGALKVDSVRFEKPGLDITIRPQTNYQPVLSIGETTERA